MDQQTIEYQVESILFERIINRKHYYLIKWKGYSQQDNTWEPVQNLQNILPYLSEWKKQKARDKKKNKIKNVTKINNQKNVLQQKLFNNQECEDKTEPIKPIKSNKQTIDEKIKKQMREALFCSASEGNVSNMDQKTQIHNKSNELSNHNLENNIEEKKQQQRSTYKADSHQHKENNEIKQTQEKHKNLDNSQNSSSNHSQQYQPNLNILEKIESDLQVNNSLLSLSFQQNYPYIPTQTQKQSVTKILKILYVSTKKYYCIELFDGRQAIINESNMKNMFPQIICDYYEQFLNEQPNQRAIYQPMYLLDRQK